MSKRAAVTVVLAAIFVFAMAALVSAQRSSDGGTVFPEPPKPHFSGGLPRATPPVFVRPPTPEAQHAREEIEEEGLDRTLDPANLDAVRSRIVVPSKTGDDAVACEQSEIAHRKLRGKEISRARFESDMKRAKDVSASSTMREALDAALGGGSPPTCPGPQP